MANNNDDGAPSNDEVVILEWKEVVASETSDSLLKRLEQALGLTGTGLVAIRNVPDFLEAKTALLPQGHTLATLPSQYLEEHLTDASSLYNAGWSHGKEKLGDNKPDWAKGSFYYNPLTDWAGTAEDRANYPLSYPPNKWPDEKKLPGFKKDAMRLGQVLTKAVVELSKHIDALALQTVDNYPPQFLYKALKDTEKAKARLLYYFPLEQSSHDGGEDTNTKEDSWIGWHNDSGFLTALAGDLYVHHATGKPIDHPPPHAGLYVADRRNNDDSSRRIEWPSDCLAVQIGECTQIVTGGTVAATPHCVRGLPDDDDDDVARIALACFVDTPPTFPLTVPPGKSRLDVLVGSNRRVPPLEQRWTQNGMTFGDFLQTTFAMYYEWSQKEKKAEESSN